MMITYTQEELSSIVHAFAFPGTITDWTPHGNGHINDTFLVRSTENGVLRKSILQRMNRTVFHNPTELMQNIAQVTSFLRKKTHSRRRRSIPRDAEPDSDDRRCLVFRR